MIRFPMVRYDIHMLRTRAEEPMTFVRDLNGRGRAAGLAQILPPERIMIDFHPIHRDVVTIRRANPAVRNRCVVPPGQHARTTGQHTWALWILYGLICPGWYR